MELRDLPSVDELAPAHHDLAALGQGVHGQEDGGRAVVDDGRGLGAQEVAQARSGVGLAVAALAAREVELQVRVGRSDLRDPGRRFPREGSAAEVRVDDDAGRVEHAPQDLDLLTVTDEPADAVRMVLERAVAQ